MSKAEPHHAARVFNADDARAIARALVHGEAGRESHWSEAAVETVAAIILWEALKRGDDGR